MTINELYSRLFGFNSSTYHRWKNEKRPIIRMLHKYFDDKDLVEFLETEKISKLEKNNVSREKLKQYDHHILYNSASKIINIPNLFGGKKEFDLNLFIKSIQKTESREKIKEEIEKEKKFYNTIIINGTIEKVDMFSDLELELIHNNFDEFEKMIK